jgi:hypothetical protein
MLNVQCSMFNEGLGGIFATQAHIVFNVLQGHFVVAFLS